MAFPFYTKPEKTKAEKLAEEAKVLGTAINKALGLNAPRHKGFGKEGLDEGGRLYPGYMFDGNGKVVPSIANLEGVKLPNRKRLSTYCNKTNTLSENTIVKQKIVKPQKNSEVFNMSISKINIDKARFQNRNKLNETVLNQIVSNYSTTKLDPIIIWIDKDKKTYLLAGHHRFEATKRVGKKTVPAKYFTGSESEAIRYAKVESNANRSLELPQERAKIYREMFAKSTTKANVLSEAKKLEGKNANYIVNLSFLNPNGLTIQALDQLSDTPDKQNETLIVKITDWIGEARRNNEKLTNAHEKEIFDFLQDKNSSERIKTKADFLQKIVATTGMFFDYETALNLKKFKYETQGEAVYNQEYKELQIKVETAINNKQNLIDRIKNPMHKDFINPTDKDYTAVIGALEKAIEKYNSEIKTYQSKLIALSRNKGKYTNAGSNQAGLFGTAENKETFAFNKQILLAKRNGYKNEFKFNLGFSKGILESIIGKHKITLTGSVINKAMNKDKSHSLRWEHLINLPDALNKPLAIFKSITTGFVVLTEITDELNKPLMVALHFDKFFSVQDIRSIYSKTNDSTYKNWKEAGLLLYENKKSKIFARILGLNPSSANKVLSENKDNKNDTKKPNLGLNSSKPNEVNENSLAYKMANQPKNVEYFVIPDKEINRFLGKIEKKTKESVFISLTGGQGSMKTRIAFQLMNVFAQNYKVGHVSIEEHPESVLYFDKAKQYLNAKAQNNISNPEIKNVSSLHELISENDVVVIDSFTKLKEIEKTFEVDRDLRKKYNGKLFIVIFQQTTNGSMRGGAKSQFDADIVLFTEKFDDYTKNYVYADKNRYNSESGLKFNIYKKQLVQSEIESASVQSKIKKLSFTVN